LTACVAPGAAPAGSAAGGDQKVKVVYWAYDFPPRAELDKKYIEEFMKENPNI
jgi:ABC-type glycerol-3-phosphate transport system substrate-binding protein